MMAPKHKVLLIEDNPLNMELATDLLESSGLIVWQARTAEEGLCLARALPDIIVMDLSLPGIDGLSAMRLLRADMAINHLTVIALTAHAMRGDEANAIRAGFDGYLTKPIDTRTFTKTVTDFIKASVLHQRAAAKTADSFLEAPVSNPTQANP